MNNLFSIFDPTTSLNFSFNWLMFFFLMLFIPSIYWIIPSRLNFSFLNILMILYKEMKMLLNMKNFFNLLIFNSMFITIMLMNFLSLFPYIFNLTSHLSISLSFSLPLWITFMTFGWKNYFNTMFIHLIPSGSPMILIPFMILIETISNMIRPLTLSIRLSANMIAGHLLLTLLSQSINNLNIFFIITLINLMIILELSVSIIQSYVFTMLSSLYMNEI